ncbi:MAG TPA: MFS transporter [Anaerolineae bacterium]|nr:MFS transporter [Anaerolineae bacterium]
MNLKRFQPTPIPRADNVSDRVVRLSLLARFFDELLGGAPDVLMPTIRATLGLTYAQVSLLPLTLNYVGAIIEPINGILIDIWPRRRLLAWGALGLGLALITIGLAPTLLVLILAYAIYGLASGPLAHTADVILVETHPTAPDRIYARSTFIDTIGALLAPLLVVAVSWAELPWQYLMYALGLSAIVYAIFLWRTHFPSPPTTPTDQTDDRSGWQTIKDNIRFVLTHTGARYWLFFLLLHSIQELPLTFMTIWLREEAGLSQALVGLYKAMEMGVALLSLTYLDRWRQTHSAQRVLQIAGLGVLILYPIWLFWPNIWGRFLWGIPLTFLLTVYWPIAKSQSLASVPGKGGTVTAVHSLFGFLPLALLFGLLAQTITLTTAMLLVHTLATLLLLALTLKLKT